MPTFNISIDGEREEVDIDIDEFLYELSYYEKQDLADELYTDGYVPSEVEDRLNEQHPNYGNEFLFRKWSELFKVLSEKQIEELLKTHNIITI